MQSQLSNSWKPKNWQNTSHLDRVKRKKVHVIYVVSLHRTSLWVLRRWPVTQRVPHCPVSAFISITGPSAWLEHLHPRQPDQTINMPSTEQWQSLICPVQKRNVHIQTADTHLGFTFPALVCELSKYIPTQEYLEGWKKYPKCSWFCLIKSTVL